MIYLILYSVKGFSIKQQEEIGHINTLKMVVEMDFIINLVVMVEEDNKMLEQPINNKEIIICNSCNFYRSF
jgi:hypothetical protein